MAKFNGNIYGKQYANDETENKKCAVFLQECLVNEEYELLKADYDKTDKSSEYWSDKDEATNIDKNSAFNPIKSFFLLSFFSFFKFSSMY